MRLESYAQGEWYKSSANAVDLFHAVTGDKVAEATSDGLDFSAMLEYGKKVGGPNLQKFTFHQRAVMLKEIAIYLLERKKELYKTSSFTGATKTDSWIDIEGGIGTFFTYSGKGRRDMPDDFVYVDGPIEPLSKEGSFIGRHICTPLEGTAVHINAFNFPIWGMLEKIAPTFLAGMPAIVKPATATSYLTEHCVKLIIESGILPEGALQLIVGGVGDLLDHLTCQDVVTFTGSAATGMKLKAHPNIIENAVRFNMEADSLNFSMMGPDVEPGMPEFDLFIKEVAREMTVKAGQKCTAIRRTIVPENRIEAVAEALSKRLAKTVIGDPANENVRMGPLASRGQVEDVRDAVKRLSENNELLIGRFDDFDVVDADRDKGAFFPSMVMLCKDPIGNKAAHEIEPFGPVSTLMPFKSVEDAVEMIKLGKGSLVGSVFTASDEVAKQVTMGVASYHGRLVLLNEESSKESTGHGSPMPQLVHGGPGRAGGGEELGGIRSVLHYMQRTALQGSPTTLTHICNEYMRGAKTKHDPVHPFRKYFEEIEVGDSLLTPRRTISEADIVNFAGISGDYFYAHMDKIAAKESPIFEDRVAHGYFVLSAAAGLFVDPAPGPILANYGLESLRFTEPVYVGDTIQVLFTCKKKMRKYGKNEGVVEWDVDVRNQEGESVALYSILTLVATKEQVEEAS